MSSGAKEVANSDERAQASGAEIQSCQHALTECRERLEQVEGLFAHVADAVFLARTDGRIIDVNPAACAMLGYSREELLTFHQWDIVTSASRDEILRLWQSMMPGAPVTVQRTCRTKNGHPIEVELRLARCSLGGRDLIIVTCRDVTEQTRARAMLAGEKHLLEMIAKGEPLTPILEALCRMGEEMSPETLVSILLLSTDGKRLRHGAAPSLPKRYTEAIDGALIGPSAGSCGTAAYRKELVIVSNIETDPLWADYRHLALAEGLRACWSTPVFSTKREVLGTFALYSRNPASPTPDQLCVVEQFAYLASIAIERAQSAEALRASEHLARGQLNALTQTLDALAQESDPDKLLEHVLRTIVEQSGAHSVSAWERNDDDGCLDLIAVIEDGRFQTRKDTVHPAGRIPILALNHPVWSEVLRTGQHGVLEDIDQPSARMSVGTGPEAIWHRVLEDTDPNPAIVLLKQHLRNLGVRAILFVPMLVAGRVTGIIGVRFPQKRLFRQDDIELTRALANQATLAIQLMRLSQQSRESAVVAERNRMARDIHDTLAQGFTGVIMQMEAAKGAAERNDLAEVTGRIDRAGELARSSLAEARRSVRALRLPSLQAGKLSLAIDDLLKRMADGSALQAEFHADGEERLLASDCEETLLRITQEALTNTIKHAQARNFRATLSIREHETQLQLVDDGRGFDPLAEHEGFGLTGMKERVDRMGGEFIVRSKPGQGTEIVVTWRNPNGHEQA